MPLGDCAAVRIGGTHVVLSSLWTQALSQELFTNVGIDPNEKRILVLKSANHFLAAFGLIAARVLFADSGGLLALDPRRIPYRQVTRPIWRLDKTATPMLIE